MNPGETPTELILASLRGGEKTMSELFTLTRLSYSTVQKHLVQLVKDGTVERRWQEEGTRGKYFYKLKA
jgi:predicted transcriptional regulator